METIPKLKLTKSLQRWLVLVRVLLRDIRQRGIGNPNPVKLGRCIKELERIYGVRDGSANEKGSNRIGEPKVSDDQLSQSDIADMIGISVDTLSNYKKLTELVPELQDWVETEARNLINKGFQKLILWIK